MRTAWTQLRLSAALVCVALMTHACGYRGPLYYPTDPSPAQQKAAQPSIPSNKAQPLTLPAASE